MWLRLFCAQVRRLHETFHEPFRKTLRQSQLDLTPSTAGASARRAAQSTRETGSGVAEAAPGQPHNSRDAAAMNAAMSLDDDGSDEGNLDTKLS
jgi:hypothetical protein